MTIGETLARARRDAGLSVADVSSQTRIRPDIVDGIEHNDFSLCDGDFYARGQIRAIARAVGIHAGPLIDAYDAGTWAAAQPSGAARPADPVLAAEAADPSLADDPTAPIPAIQGVDPAEADEPAHAAGVFHPIPVMPAPTHRIRGKTIMLVGVVLLAVAALSGYLLAFGGGGQAARQASAPSGHRAGGHGASHAAAPTSPSRGHRRSHGHRNGPAVHVLRPVHIAAFGPGGVSQGDSQQLAHLALTGRPATPWHSSWYTTAHFGNLQSGTGLILDMGRKVTVTSARIALGYGPGANVELRIGNARTLSGLRGVARAKGAGGVIQLHPRRTRGRYVLVWFTKLPPDHAGTFQASVYRVILLGY